MIYATNRMLKDTALAMKVLNFADLPIRAGVLLQEIKEKDKGNRFPARAHRDDGSRHNPR